VTFDLFADPIYQDKDLAVALVLIFMSFDLNRQQHLLEMEKESFLGLTELPFHLNFFHLKFRILFHLSYLEMKQRVG
jgi:hypothetical protein